MNNEVIKLAIEKGGYLYEGLLPRYEPYSSRTQSGWIVYSEYQGVKLSKSVNQHQVILDPLFWQALGKARGWGTYDKGTTTAWGSREIGEVSLLNWHRFIEHLWTGQDAESFFASL